MARPRISRFTIDLATKKLDLDSEVVIFEYDAQIYSLLPPRRRHGLRLRGQPLRHHRRLELVAGHERLLGQQPSRQRARPARPTEAVQRRTAAPTTISLPATRAGPRATPTTTTARCCGSTRSSRSPDGAKPAVGVGTTYTLPTAASPNGPNLFNGTEGGGGKTKPEIYAMGLRNPSRLSIDPKTDVPYAAWVGPDAGSPVARRRARRRTRTPRRSRRAGNYGWPYCMGNQQAYRDRIADGTLRTTNAAGLRAPAARPPAPTDGWYDCNNLVNDSTNNTGLIDAAAHHGHGQGRRHGARATTSGTAAATRAAPTAARSSRVRARRRRRARTTAPTPTQLCPYITASRRDGLQRPGLPLRRRRRPTTRSAGPSTGTAAGSCTTTATASAKHALLLDPATDQDGGQPVYADSLRGAPDVGRELHGLEVRSGRRALRPGLRGLLPTGPNAGLYRFAYTGGADTPGPDPQWQSTGDRASGRVLDRRAPAASPTSGTSATARRRRPTPNPTHTYAAAGTYTAKLTVTYADGEKASEDDRA